MSFDFDSIESLRSKHPAWRLLRADQAPLIIAFLHRVFVKENVRTVSQADLAERLEDEIFAINDRLGKSEFPKSALSYLNDWCAPEKGWLRKFYKKGSDEPLYDLTPAAEKAITWIVNLSDRSFIGTESRLLTLFDLLRQMAEGSESNPALRIAELQKRKEEIDRDIERIKEGNLPILDDSALKDRFQQFTSTARELLSDFREVEHNFRGLDRQVREKVTLWDGAKGALLEEIMGQRDEIADSDQGRSFRGFWDFLMSGSKQEELSKLLDKVLALPAVSLINPDPRMRRVHYDWQEAGEHTQKTVALLSQQLRRFLDDAAWLENKRIMEILHGIEAKALALRLEQPVGDFMTIASPASEIELPMERKLFTPAIKPRIKAHVQDADESDIDASALFLQSIVDKDALAGHIRRSLQQQNQVTLSDLIASKPLEHGLAELMVYLQLATDSFESVIDEDSTDVTSWFSEEGKEKTAVIPRVIFVR
ncbi:MAG: DUF3375 domain-containing protein [Candidatus Obscuribacterales bacterium]|nr:DUF3375 domain-containing protein [Candidatus Obscuribacterales bacterium]